MTIPKAESLYVGMEELLHDVREYKRIQFSDEEGNVYIIYSDGKI